jgi:translation initiation factor IF-3
VRLAAAQDIAAQANLDLVEVAADARPPVCRIMDYGKYRYEQEQKAKQARKHQSTITIKEIKFRPKIDPHDYATKKGHVVRFLKNKDKVKVTIMFRGRELIHPERGEAILMRLADEVKDMAPIESRPNLDGRNMVMMLAPIKTQAPGALVAAEDAPAAAEPAPAAGPAEPAPAQPPTPTPS